MNIPHEIKQARLALGLTQAEFVDLYNASAPEHLQISQTLLSRYETGEITPPSDKYVKLVNLHLKQ